MTYSRGVIWPSRSPPVRFTNTTSSLRTSPAAAIWRKAATVVAEQVQDLAAQGVREFHFYTLNRADLTFAICHILGLRPAPAEARP